VIATARTDGPRANPTLATSHDGRYVFVRTGDAADAVKILDTGIVSESHGDHIDIEKREVALLGITVSGERPSHITSGFGQAGLFFDGPRGGDRRTGSKAILLELASLHTQEPRLRTWDSPGAQHGLAVPLGRHVWALSMPNRAYVEGDGSATSLPEGVAVVRAREVQKQSSSSRSRDTRDRAHPCREMHGHAAVGQIHVFGCSAQVQGEAVNNGGILVLGTAGYLMATAIDETAMYYLTPRERADRTRPARPENSSSVK